MSYIREIEQGRKKTRLFYIGIICYAVKIIIDKRTFQGIRIDYDAQ
ncbi:MAG: hypothetical protein KKC66_04230 [Candidatus Omnitrophica bacterium]|nr:hypothetical protein [Candidatus Omnitrophota bacterium]MBU1933088.1 hypothetical protein [Candidatus Omnitrophota bacterium]